jgi:hypothetical protein
LARPRGEVLLRPTSTTAARCPERPRRAWPTTT